MKKLILLFTVFLTIQLSSQNVLTITISTSSTQTYEINGTTTGDILIATEVDSETVRMTNETNGSINTYKTTSGFTDFEINGVNPTDVNDAVFRINEITKKLTADVVLQDSTSPIFSIYFVQELGPPTTLTSATTIEDMTIDVVSVTNFSVGTWIGIFSGDGRYFWSEVLAINSNTLTLDSPLDFAFEIGDNVLPTNRNMAVDGSVTPQIFSVQVGTSGLNIDVTRAFLSLVTVTPVELNDFGDLAPLTNGVVLRLRNGIYRNFWNIKTNYEMAVNSDEVVVYEQVKQNDVNALLSRHFFGGQERHGAVIRLMPNEQLQVIIQDDLTGLITFNAIAQGSEVVIP